VRAGALQGYRRSSPHGGRRPLSRQWAAPVGRAACWIAVLLGACGGLPDGSDRGSQPAEVRQRMGGTEIAVVYNRPSARGRELFGGLVPYDSVWNPGADEATRIELSDDILIEGERLPAGKYSIWAIPRPDEWTLIFSRAHDVFHVPYPEGQDALRLAVRPRRASHMETMAFTFPVATRDSAELRFHWGEVVLSLGLRPGN
ncbi:MAG: DUF2911 domain-containing protein, partial [Planctomycetaceae bacterium]